jgi:Na+/H+ antiporter NhaD/arsenite permease-like protein
MFELMVILFVLGYIVIALEHSLNINKAATALFMGVILWVVYIIGAKTILSGGGNANFIGFLKEHPDVNSLPIWEQYIQFIAENQLLKYLAEISEILFFLLGAMTIVEIVDQHEGFNIITDKITTRKKVNLLWILGFITFFMSAVLDNLTTSIVMIALLRKIIPRQHDRWFFAGIIIIAANAGGAWSPIGDVTTIMLWINGNVSSEGIIPHLFVPSLMSLAVPLAILSFFMKGTFERNTPKWIGGEKHLVKKAVVTEKERWFLLILGVSALLFVPVFKVISHLPPFMGMLLGLSVIWIVTEIMYHSKKDIDKNEKLTVSKVIKNVDIPTVLFFLGILLAVNALQSAGHLSLLSNSLDKHLHNVYAINTIIGVLSSIVDNVPLVAAAMGMHNVITPDALALAADPEYLKHFTQDGTFWSLLAYCAGTGGSILIIGSAAGVAVMGLEKIDFIWYLKKISLLALVGYAAGIISYALIFGFN